MELDKEYPHIRVTEWGYGELQRKVLSLDERDLIPLLGPSLSASNMVSIGFEELQELLTALAQEPPSTEPDLRPPSPAKLQFNGLSDHMQLWLRLGFAGAANVERFFGKWQDPTLADKIAEGFRQRYLTLQSLGLPPNVIFFSLQEFIAGPHRGSPQRESAVWAVLAYFFEKCDIFERPPETI